MNKISAARPLLYFWLLAITVVALPYSIKVCHGGILLLLMLWATEGDFLEKWNKFKSSLYLKLLALILIVNVIGLAYTTDVHNGLATLERKAFILLIPLALGTSNVVITDAFISGLFKFFVATCFVGTLICFAKAFGSFDSAVTNDYLQTTDFSILNAGASSLWYFVSYVSLAEGIDMHPTYLALYVGFCMIVVYRAIRRMELTTFERVLLWTLMVYFIVFLVCLSSRIVLLALVGMAVIYCVHQIWVEHKIFEGVKVGFLVLLVSITLYSNPISWYRSYQEFTHTSLQVQSGVAYQNSLQIRLSLWWTAMKSIKLENLLLGSGTGATIDVMETEAKKHGISNVINSYDPHNEFLYSQISHGLIGSSFLFLMFTVPLIIAWRMKDHLYMAFIVLFAVLCLTESALELQKGIAFFSLVNSLFLLRLKGFELPSLPIKKLSMNG